MAKLTTGNLAELYSATCDARDKWRSVLFLLGLSSDSVWNVARKYDNPEDCYREGLKEWLKGGERTWKDVVEALSRAGLSHIAKAIERDHVQSAGAVPTGLTKALDSAATKGHSFCTS